MVALIIYIFVGGLCTEGNLRFQIDWASLILGRKFTAFLCLTLYLRAISKYKPPGGRGLVFGGEIYRRAFALRIWGVYILRVLYLEGLIFGISRYVPPRSQVSEVFLENGKFNCERYKYRAMG